VVPMVNFTTVPHNYYKISSFIVTVNVGLKRLPTSFLFVSDFMGNCLIALVKNI
jgi:hypothetical protein